jgi:anti-anti-sigma factor
LAVGWEGVRVERGEGSGDARVSGELDLATSDGARAALSPLLEASEPITLYVSDLTFVDSSGIRLFIQLHQAHAERGGLILRSPRPNVARVLKIAGLPEVGIRIQDPSA